MKHEKKLDIFSGMCYNYFSQVKHKCKWCKDLANRYLDPARLHGQTIKDFTQIDIAKPEAFWAAINLADKSAMSKICKDNVIKKCVASLFNLHKP